MLCHHWRSEARSSIDPKPQWILSIDFLMSDSCVVPLVDLDPHVPPLPSVRTPPSPLVTRLLPEDCPQLSNSGRMSWKELPHPHLHPDFRELHLQGRGWSKHVLMVNKHFTLKGCKLICCTLKHLFLYYFSSMWISFVQVEVILSPYGYFLVPSHTMVLQKAVPPPLWIKYC